jgi:epoxyqueuosine reductase QueG
MNSSSFYNHKKEMVRMGLAEDIKEFAKILEIDFIGFSPVNRFDEAPEDKRPTAYLKNALSVISIGYKLNYSSIQNIPKTRSAYMLEHDYANRHLDQTSHKITKILEKQGFAAIGFDAGAGFYHKAGKIPEKIVSDFSHKHTAVACGLGKFGLNNLVLSPKWGPRLRLTAIITDAEFEYPPIPIENLCLINECKRCVEICPVHALDGWEKHYDPEKGWGMDKKRCYEYMFTTLGGQRCGLCIKACPVGLNK